MAKSKIIILISIAILIALAIVAGIIWKMGLIGGPKIDQNRKVFQESISSLNTLDPDKISQGIPVLEKLVQSIASSAVTASSTVDETYAKILLAISYFNIIPPDLGKGTELLKEISTGEKYPPIWKALAIYQLTLAINSREKSFSEQYIFNTEPFKSIYEKSKKGLSLTVKKIAELSDGIYPTTMANYQIANWYADQLAKNKFYPSLSKSQENSYFSTAVSRLDKGGQIFDHTSQNEKNNLGNDTLVNKPTLKGVILTKLYAASSTESFKKQAEASFIEAKLVYDSIYLPKKMWLDIPFNYAAFMAETGGSSRAEEIKNLLNVFFDPGTDKKGDFFNLLKNEKSSSYDKTYMKRQIILLAGIDPRFKSLLKDLGWTGTDFKATVKPLK